MNFITSGEIRQREKMQTDYMKTLIHPVGGWGMFYRRADGPIPGMQCAFGLQFNGYPDIVISGTTDTKTQQHQTLLNLVVTELLTNLPLPVKTDYVDDINFILAANGLQTTYKAVIIDTEQFLNGYGINVNRFYEDYPRDNMCFVQLVETMFNGEFPTESQPNQMLFHTKPFGYKETTQ